MQTGGGAHADLRGVNLRGVNLRGVNLSDANLRGANLSYANITGVNLSYADLTGVNFSYANLSGVNLSGANLIGAIGNGKEVRTLQTPIYIVTCYKNIIQIGCERHTFQEWLGFDDKTISDMEDGALEFWGEWKTLILDFSSKIKI